MGRPKWNKKDARAVHYRLNEVVQTMYGGVQAEFVRTCRLSRDTAAKWFGVGSFRVPDTLTLKRIAERSGISLDWLLLGQGEMLGPAASPGAKAELFQAIYRRMNRTYARDPYSEDAAKTVLEELDAEGLWDVVVRNTEGVGIDGEGTIGGKIGMMAYHHRLQAGPGAAGARSNA
jgi:hypothetical protein